MEHRSEFAERWQANWLATTTRREQLALLTALDDCLAHTTFTSPTDYHYADNA